ncbi:UDP-glucuronosyltransferase 2B14 [Orchesella cincta]|uniref:UDP-glucuronosyltransferase n=1 Tax=Orchesella cincta TaxID=48709 RepID=A0A1D2NEE8_ORCCI|nr:UDP-glucuronosyltransferase 2B14 [Orchesella cincta]
METSAGYLFWWALVFIISASVLSPSSCSVEGKSSGSDVQVSEKKSILFLLPLSSKSHKHVFEPLIRGLANNGHEIIVIAATKSSNMPPNVREIVVVKDEEIFDDWADPLENRKKGKLGTLLWISTLPFVFCFYGMLTYFEAPFISLATLPPWNVISLQMGTHLPPSFIPVPFFTLPEKMNFLQRVQNNLFDWMVPYIMRYFYTAKLEKVYQNQLGSHYPSAEEIEANASMMLTNSHFSLNPKMPLLPDIVEVGGMHLRPSKPLPKELETFLSDAKDGFILFSLGSIVRAKNMPEEMRKTFLRVFAKIKQKVIWKWETESMPDTPPNVKISKWLPQQDILGHPNIKLFMTHGGLLSVQEAVYHGVPLLGLPVFGDQDINVAQAENAGFALSQEILEVNEDDLLAKIDRLLTENRFREKIKQLSKVMRDQPQSPLERSLFWSEYVMRHKGAPHLRSPARDLNWIQYHSVDVAAFVFFIFSTTVLLLLYVLRKLCACFISKRNSENYDRKKKLK